MSQKTGIRSGIWRGEIGSSFHLTLEKGKVSGIFQTVHGSPTFEEKFEVTGFSDGELIGFTVLWHGHHSVTAWAGRYGIDEKGEFIRSMWHLVHKYKDRQCQEPTEIWNSYLSNASQLYLVPGSDV